MALIDNEEAARRLARVILSDIELYQQKRIDAGEDMTGDLAEGRALFGRRVAPQLVPIFDATLATRRLGGRAGSVPAPPMPIPVVTPTAPPPPSPSPAPAAAAATISEIADAAVGAEMSQAETGRSPVTSEIAQSMMVDGSGGAAAGASEEAGLSAVPPAAAAPEPKLPTDDRATPVPVEDVVSRPSMAPEDRPPQPPVNTAPEPPAEPPREEPVPPEPVEAPADEERITARGMAVFSEPTEEPITLPSMPSLPPLPLPLSPAAAAPPAPIPTPPPIPAAARGGTPRPVVLAQRPPEGAGQPPSKTPQPLSPATVAPGQSSAGVRIGTPASSPRLATPFRSSTFQPLNLPPMPEAAMAAPMAAAPAEAGPAPADAVVNLRKKTSKVVVLLVVLAVIGGVMLIGRFLTRFI